MNVSLITVGGSRRALLLFAGWGMDPRPFEGLQVPGYDLWVVWDYTEPTFDSTPLEGYQEVTVVAWSYGVAMAAVALEGLSLKLTRRVAVNGTLHPVDEALGIPEAIFRGTLEGLSEDTLARFNRRMAGGAAAMKQFAAKGPRRSIDSLRAELTAIAETAERGIPVSLWDEAVISSRDMIIPTASQRRAWEADGAIAVTEIDAPHLPDFATLLPRLVVDKECVTRRFTRSAASYDANADIQQQVAQTLASMVLPALPERAVVYEIGPGTGIFTRMLAASTRVAAITTVDLAPVLEPFESVVEIATLTADAETSLDATLPAGCNAILSASAIQWFNSPRAFLERAARHLPPGGILAFATYGADNFAELDSVLPGRRRYPSAEQWGAMLPPSMEIVDIRSALIVKQFNSPLDILKHMKSTGVNATGDSIAPRQFIDRYPAANTLTFNPVWILSRKKQI